MLTGGITGTRWSQPMSSHFLFYVALAGSPKGLLLIRLNNRKGSWVTEENIIKLCTASQFIIAFLFCVLTSARGAFSHACPFRTHEVVFNPRVVAITLCRYSIKFKPCLSLSWVTEREHWGKTDLECLGLCVRDRVCVCLWVCVGVFRWWRWRCTRSLRPVCWVVSFWTPAKATLATSTTRTCPSSRSSSSPSTWAGSRCITATTSHTSLDKRLSQATTGLDCVAVARLGSVTRPVGYHFDSSASVFAQWTSRARSELRLGSALYFVFYSGGDITLRVWYIEWRRMTRVLLATHVKVPWGVGHRRSVEEISPAAMAKW